MTDTSSSSKEPFLVFGSTGGIGAAICDQLSSRFGAQNVIGFSRSSDPSVDILDEETIRATAQTIKQAGMTPRLIFDATGALSWDGHKPEKTWKSLDPSDMEQAFRINTIGPALLMKHFLPLLPRTGKSVFATLSARVGSIGDNHIGGWYSYRASKAALNQLVRCASIELARTRKEAICVALHPGTVETPLSTPFAKQGLEVQSPDVSAKRLLAVLDRLTTADTGSFFDHMGEPIVW